MIHSPMLVRSLVLTAFLAPCVCWAQTPEFFFFEATEPLSPQQFKLVVEAVEAADPQAGVFRSDDYGILQIKTSGLLTESDYRQTVADLGITLRPGLRSAEELGIGRVPDVPVFVATGDDEADLARYRDAVDAWNNAHPDQLLSPVPVHRQ